MRSIQEIAERLEIPREYLLSYGEELAKVKLDFLGGTARGKMILVTAITPTQHGEGKTVTSIGLAQGLSRIGQRAVATLREPSLGPVFGLKGGATGGGASQVLPAERINLHCTGDFHAITSAHNLLAAAVDWHLQQGNELRLDINRLFWPRAMDMNDRALRHIVTGLGGSANGTPRETGFVITAASEMMAIVGLAGSREDLRHRLGEIVIGADVEGRLVRARQLGLTGALMVLLQDALLPNLAQTTEGTPVFVHTGPFANIAHGTSSVISQRMALQCADYVVNEAGFGADLGAEKYFHLVMPQSGIRPAAVVLVATVRALAAHGGEGGESGSAAVERGLPNLARHLDNLLRFGIPVVVAINRFPTDEADEVEVIRRYCAERGLPVAECEAYLRGGEGAEALAERVVEAVTATGAPAEVPPPLYTPDLPFAEKIQRVACQIYGADGVRIEAAAQRKLDRFAAQGYGHLPVCMAKTQSSFSDNPSLRGAPKGWTLTITDAHLSAGAGFVVAVAGSMMLMPGLPKVPQAAKLDLDEQGRIIGMNY
jgi:formate--tetrahydrofolate ligase